MNFARLTRLAMISFSVSACTITSANPPDTHAQAIQKACDDYATSLCTKLDSCRLNGTAMAYGGQDTCIAVQRDRCVAAQSSPGDGNTPQATEACATALPSATCQEDLENDLVMCPQAIGALVEGAACVFNSQCETGFCQISSGVACGVCAAAPVEGDSCDGVSCGRDQTCSPMKTCEPWVETGGTCDKDTRSCAPHNWCVIPSGMTTGTCEASAAEVGASCDYKKQTAPGCDFYLGLFCNSANTCVANTYVSAGDPCGPQNGGASTNICSNASTCFDSTCVADGVEGDDCDTQYGPSCISGVRCITDGTTTSGTCTVVDPNTCR